MCNNLTDTWDIGDRCLAPFRENGKLCQATVTALQADENGHIFATVSFNGFQEKKISVAELCRIKTNKNTQKNLMFDDEDLEKPYFPDRRLPSPAVAFDLSGDGACIPYTINRYLRDYQRKGAQFLHGHYVRKNGCILGDDMGLGKTIQVISFLAAELNKKGTRADIENNMPEFLLRTMKKEMPSVPKKTFLIVTPLSVLYNWKDELETWGYFKVIVLHGSRKDYELCRIKRGKCEIALTTYETLRLYLDELNSLVWSAIIVDEVHRLKNPRSQITQTMKALNCKIRIGLTGTILQNNMKELWCVIDWAIPGLLGSEARFKKDFSDPVEHGQRHNATKRELATGRKAMKRLAQKMSGYFLRRTKALIHHQLPKKEDRFYCIFLCMRMYQNIQGRSSRSSGRSPNLPELPRNFCFCPVQMVYCSLTEFQAAVYKAVLETEDVRLVLRAREQCSCNSGRKRKNCCYKTNAHGETMQALFFSYLTILRKIANHAALLQTERTSKQQEAYITRVCSEVFSKFPDFIQLSKDAAFETISDPKYSGKMKVLQKLLNYFRKNKDKVLLFSFSTKLLDVLEQYCMASGLDYRRLDGNTKAEDRVRIVKEFNSMEEVNICLVSTMAGGLGLNFVGANIVVLFDPTWNPANDLQAIDRAYRIGQCRDVKVFRLISLGTVEEVMYLRQVYKQQLHCAVVGSENAKRYFEAVQGSKEHQGELFGIHNLFKLQVHGSCLTKEILERVGRVEAGVMTATTWLEEEPQPQREEMSDDQDITSLKKPLEREEFDCSSDEEPVSNSKVKAKWSSTKNTKVPQGQLTLLQCGFLQLLEKGTEISKDGVGASDDEDDDDKSVVQTSKGSSEMGFSPKTLDHCNIAEHQITSLLPVREEKDFGSKYKDLCVSDGAGVVMESEDSSTENDIIYPSQFPANQRSVKSCNSIAVNLEHLATERSPAHLQKDLTSEWSVLPFSKIKSYEHVQKISSEKEGSDISDESDDIEISPQSGSRKQNATSLVKQKLFHNKEIPNCSRTVLHGTNLNTREGSAESQNIEEFSSPEDSVRKIDMHKQRLKNDSRRIHFDSKFKGSLKRASVTLRKRSNSSIHQNSPGMQMLASQAEKVGSLDQLLDGVAEVSYVHSNQNVVGSSKAENQMSRWAVRDVFELQQFSQLPANVAVCGPKNPCGCQDLTVNEIHMSGHPDLRMTGAALQSHPKSSEECSLLSLGRMTEVTGTKFSDVQELPKYSTTLPMTKAQAFLKMIASDFGAPLSVSSCMFQLGSKEINGGNVQKDRENSEEALPRRKKGTKKDNSEGETSSVLYITHPVYQKQKRIHQVGSVTFLIGRTPKKIRRKQFEEMASDVHMASVKEFAKYIAQATSEDRQKILKEFYGAKHPELKDVLKVDVPVSEESKEGDAHTAQSRERKFFSKHGKLKSGPSAAQALHCSSADICGQKRHEARAKQIQYNSCTQAAECHNVEDKQLPTVITQDSISGRNSQAFNDFMASDSLSSKSGVIEGLCENTSKGQQNLKGTESPRKPSLSQSESKPAQICKKNSFADILGDTSILNDLFKVNGDRPTELPRRSLSGLVEKAKVRPKDFWDMLNEQNEESFQKLTDVAIIEELCDRGPLVTLSKKEEEKVSLWKKNDNFLWRKYCTDDMDK